MSFFSMAFLIEVALSILGFILVPRRCFQCCSHKKHLVLPKDNSGVLRIKQVAHPQELKSPPFLVDMKCIAEFAGLNICANGPDINSLLQCMGVSQSGSALVVTNKCVTTVEVSSDVALRQTHTFPERDRDGWETILNNDPGAAIAFHAGGAAAQYVLHCVNLHDDTQDCTRAIDQDAETHVLIRATAQSSIVIQHPTAASIDRIEMFYPPTEEGGEYTAEQNVWYFKFQCFTGQPASGNVFASDALDDDANWNTVYDNTAEADATNHVRTPGWRVYTPQACSSATWRFASMRALSNCPQIAVFEIRLNRKSAADYAPNLALPRLGAALMTLEENAVITTFDVAPGISSIRMGLSCTEVLYANHGVIGKTLCSALNDGDVNTPTLFNLMGGGPLGAAMGLNRNNKGARIDVGTDAAVSIRPVHTNLCQA